ncbi:MULTISPECIES: 1,2-phenylacetyl-CoA epoxidase subunit PaaD [unclassified Plantactinospora]|uniref:1,2-phenylacetyl-CoA epoxidase subunit PaaD n=1 Tax=unclassified Plantactinospora TaxID=2631981 RepID=UPI000D15E1E0|nr:MULTISPECIES: 1,2-phenylacetyl-CoA epoxidase subunit PaaD [unclassified Plantactinospora]AVT31197.1 phenylacetate-CoA oxygenase subunit PaaJ [Plantactinospora sp. BC1]AVT39743.1 phenylacetate-CoA oxygenase subunit PaaJ [Plantactinospora sp. BB1]
MSAAGSSPARRAAAAVVDPELRVLTIEDLGVLRDVTEDPATGRVTVTITPTYTGCPAMDVIRADIRAALAAAGHPEAEVVTVFAPAWTTDWISEAGRAKLAAAGIAPPGPAGGRPVPVTLSVRCPHCGAADTEQVSRFGSTACKSLWRCRACREPFDHLRAF